MESASCLYFSKLTPATEVDSSPKKTHPLFYFCVLSSNTDACSDCAKLLIENSNKDNRSAEG